MAKVVMIENIPHRIRRGKLVAIPIEWLGKHTTKTTIRQRKLKAKARVRVGGNVKGSGK